MGIPDYVNGAPVRAGSWLPSEDEALAHWQSHLGNRWAAVAKHIAGRTGQQCAQRWRHRVNPAIRRDKWTDAEDLRLQSLIKRHGLSWAAISRGLKGRTDQQCMGRWRRHLDPSIKRSAWGQAEDMRLVAKVKALGSQWSIISSSFNGRTAQQCRARFFQLDSSAGSSAVKAKPVGSVLNSGRAKRRKVVNAESYEHDDDESCDSESSEWGAANAHTAIGSHSTDTMHDFKAVSELSHDFPYDSRRLSSGACNSSKSSATAATLACRRQSLVSIKSRPSCCDTYDEDNETDVEQPVHLIRTSRCSSIGGFRRQSSDVEHLLKMDTNDDEVLQPCDMNASCDKLFLFETPKKRPRSLLPRVTSVRPHQNLLAFQASGHESDEEDAEVENLSDGADPDQIDHALLQNDQPAGAILAATQHTAPSKAVLPKHLSTTSPLDSASCPWIPNSHARESDRDPYLDTLYTPQRSLPPPSPTFVPNSCTSRLDTLVVAAAHVNTPLKDIRRCSVSKHVCTPRRTARAVPGTGRNTPLSERHSCGRAGRRNRGTPAASTVATADSDCGRGYVMSTSLDRSRPGAQPEEQWSRGELLPELCSPISNHLLSLLASPANTTGAQGDLLSSPFDTRMFASPEQQYSAQSESRWSSRRALGEAVPSCRPVARSLLAQLGAEPDFVSDLLVSTPAKARPPGGPHGTSAAAPDTLAPLPTFTRATGAAAAAAENSLHALRRLSAPPPPPAANDVDGLHHGCDSNSVALPEEAENQSLPTSFLPLHHMLQEQQKSSIFVEGQSALAFEHPSPCGEHLQPSPHVQDQSDGSSALFDGPAKREAYTPHLELQNRFTPCTPGMQPTERRYDAAHAARARLAALLQGF